jgi:hypothetical protein
MPSGEVPTISVTRYVRLVMGLPFDEGASGPLRMVAFWTAGVG